MFIENCLIPRDKFFLVFVVFCCDANLGKLLYEPLFFIFVCTFTFICMTQPIVIINFSEPCFEFFFASYSSNAMCGIVFLLVAISS